jgi:hypothetical protein
MKTYFFRPVFVVFVFVLVVALLLDDGFGGTASEFEEIFVSSSCLMKILFDSTRRPQEEIFILFSC